MDKLINILNEFKIPFAYDHFAEGESPSTPFVCYKLPRSENLSADGKVYHKLSEVRIAVYTDKKDLETELKVENVLDKYNMFYNKDETWIESEKMYEVIFTFTMEVI